MNEQKTYLRLFASCIPVKGASRSSVCDIERGEVKLIPNLLYEVLKQAEKKPIAEVKAAYNHEEDEGIDAYFNQFVNQEWAFYTEEPQCYPPLPIEWDIPAQLTNALIDWSPRSTYDLYEVINQLNDLGCQAIQLRTFGNFSLEDLEKLLQHTKASRIKRIELLLQYHAEMTEEALQKFYRLNLRLRSLTIHSAPFEQSLKHKSRAFNDIFHFTTQILTASSQELEHVAYFAVNMLAFMEAQHHNLGLNRKVSITETGELKHFPNHSKSYGKVSKIKLEELIAQEAFTKYWFISKDQVEICQDCEFRYICTDHTELKPAKEAGLYERITPCGYNPYTTEGLVQ